MRIIKKILDCIYVIILSLYKCTYALIKGIYKYPIKKDQKKDILILGNGPSLHNIDIDKLQLKDIDIVCVNYFPSKEKMFWEIKPKYLCLIDSVFFKKIDIFEKEKKELFDALEKVDWDIKVICLYKNMLPIENKHITYEWVTPVSLCNISLPRFRYFFYKKNLLNCGAQNVIIVVLYFFVTKKTNTIYLSGVDMSEFKSLFIDKYNNILIETIHSYGVKKINYLDYKIVNKGEFYKLLGFYAKMFEQFFLISEYAKSQNVKIYNLCKDSYIDVFEKDDQYDKKSK